ncbi:MAG: hypothetical protein WC848_06620 [Parcubacteria group bacterium]|jgi:hypothetical protein
MLIDSTDRDAMSDARLAHTHPEAYEAKMKARAEWNPIGDLINFLRRLIARKGK